MTKTLPIALITHQVSIYGRVAIGYKAEGEKEWTVLPDPVQQAQVEIIKAPERFQRQLHLKSLSYGQKWKSLPNRPDRTHTAVDGSFYFIDLPPGDYTLKAALPQQGCYLKAAEANVRVADNSKKQLQKPTWIELVMMTTGIIGRVVTEVPVERSSQDANKPEKKTELIPIAHAQVQVQGRKEKTRCDRDGNFQLLNLEAPEAPSNQSFELEISASGYETSTIKDIPLSRGVVHRIEKIQLSKTSLTKANGTKP